MVIEADDVTLARILPDRTSMTCSGILPEFSRRCAVPSGI
jgi:hypothetical protein